MKTYRARLFSYARVRGSLLPTKHLFVAAMVAVQDDDRPQLMLHHLEAYTRTILATLTCLCANERWTIDQDWRFRADIDPPLVLRPRRVADLIAGR
jgi:hypothetical protein